MKNFRKSLKELVQVNTEAGYLRLIFLIILTFILWSLLAVIFATFNPLQNLAFGKILIFNSSNLALSLFRDILNAYFSLFTIAGLILFIFIFFISFDTVAKFYSRLKPLSSIKMSKNYLSNCAFSIPQIKVFRIPDDFINFSSDIPDGPLTAVIKPGYTLLVSTRGNYKTWINPKNNIDDLEVSLIHQEKIIDCYNINPASISFNKEDNIHTKSFIIELAYSFDLPNKHESLNPLTKMFELCDSRSIREIIERVLVSEAKATFGHYYRNSGDRFPFSNNQSQLKKIRNNQKFGIEFGQKTIVIFLKLINRSKNQVIKRNRKRLLYLSPKPATIAVSKNKEYNLSQSLIDILNESFASNLQKPMRLLFGADIIRAKIIKINEQATI